MSIDKELDPCHSETTEDEIQGLFPSRGMSTGIGVYHFKIVGKSFQRRLSKTAKGSKKTFYYLKIVGKSWSAFCS